MAGERRLVLVDVLRTASILMVLGIHFRETLIGLEVAPGAEGAFFAAFQHGLYGVSIFFVMSGFLITRIIDLSEPDFFRVSFRRFYRRRAGRILPLYVAAVACGIPLLASPELSRRVFFCIANPGAIFDGAFWASLATFTFNLLRISRGDVVHGWGLHWDVMWSLAVEEQFYLVYPAVIAAARTEKRLVHFLVFIALLGPCTRYMGWLAAHIYGFGAIAFGSFGAFDLIAIGALTYLASKRWTLGPARRRRSSAEGSRSRSPSTSRCPR